MIVLPCQYDGPDHEFPDDWEFGGANNEHPAADRRFCTTTYTYYDDRAQPCWTTVVPLCDDEAIDQFTWVASLGYNPVWLSADRYAPDGSHKIDMLPWTYDKSTDTATERVSS